MAYGTTARRYKATPLRAFQLWVALPAAQENAPPESQYIPADAVEEDGPVRVILGRYGHARSQIRAPKNINYFHVRLKDGERWRYTPPHDHTVGWLAVDKGYYSVHKNEEALAQGEAEINRIGQQLRAEGRL
jgi:redox-sensitive bicupin YhaK (pirin superfamily)